MSQHWPSPCVLCGYNGPGFFQPDKHPCAEWETERDALLAEIDRVNNVVDALRDDVRKSLAASQWLEGICEEFERTVAYADWRAAGSKGMSVPFHGDFASVARLPGAIDRMRWWVREFRKVLPKKDEGKR